MAKHKVRFADIFASVEIRRLIIVMVILSSLHNHKEPHKIPYEQKDFCFTASKLNFFMLFLPFPACVIIYEESIATKNVSTKAETLHHLDTTSITGKVYEILQLLPFKKLF